MGDKEPKCRSCNSKNMSTAIGHYDCYRVGSLRCEDCGDYEMVDRQEIPTDGGT